MRCSQLFVPGNRPLKYGKCVSRDRSRLWILMRECLFAFVSFFSEKNCSTIEKQSAISVFQLPSQFQTEARCKTFLVKMSFICIRVKEKHSVIAVPAKCITDDDCLKGEAVCLRSECHCTNPLARGDGRLICDSYREYIVIGIKAFKQAFRLRERGFKIAKRRRGKMKGEIGEWGEMLRRLPPSLSLG